MIEAKIVADSVSPHGHRITTFVCTYPRFIHSEVMTHRAFSRNAASSRAIPVKTMIKRVMEETAGPISWGKNQKGMQAGEELDEHASLAAESAWFAARVDAVRHAEQLVSLGVHKQIANRLIEPFAHMTTIITATEWGNFFSLRAHEDAQPEFQELAFRMLAAYTTSEPVPKGLGEWHLPFADQYVEEGLHIALLLKIVTARCARVSYLNFEGLIEHEKDYKLHDDLLVSGHWSPFEHAACSGPPVRSGNFIGWLQYRKQFQAENRTMTAEEAAARLWGRKSRAA